METPADGTVLQQSHYLHCMQDQLCTRDWLFISKKNNERGNKGTMVNQSISD